MNYAMLADVYSAIPTSPGLVEESRKKRYIKGNKDNKGNKNASASATATTAAATPMPTPTPESAPKMNLHTQSNTVPDEEEEEQRTVVVDDYNDEYDMDINHVNNLHNNDGVFYGHNQHHPVLFEKEDDILDIVLFTIAGLMFIILLDQVFQMGVSVGQATLKFT